MNGKLIISGSITTVIILILASFPSVVGEQSTTFKAPLLSKIKDRLLWEPGTILQWLYEFLLVSFLLFGYCFLLFLGSLRL